MSYLTVTEVSKVLRCSTQTVRNLIKQGILPTVTVGNLIRVDADVLKEHLKASR